MKQHNNEKTNVNSIEKPFVGVFDSGLGGISVLAELIRVLPSVNFDYFGDSKNAPYGTKGVDFIIGRSREIVQRFVERGAVAVVIACNTATSAAAAILREEFDIPIIGMEPAIKPAIEYVRSQYVKKNKREQYETRDEKYVAEQIVDKSEENSEKMSKVAVLATPRTLAEPKYKMLVEEQGGEDIAVEIPSPELVELVENNFDDEVRIKRIVEVYAKNRIDTLEDVGAIVLGCTHFVFLKKYFEELYDIPVIDGNTGTAERLKSVLDNHVMEQNFQNQDYQMEIAGISRGQITIHNSAGETQNLKAKEMLKTELLKDDYDFVSNAVRELMDYKLEGVEAEFAEKYYIERLSLAEISREMDIKGKKLKELEKKVAEKLFKHIKNL